MRTAAAERRLLKEMALRVRKARERAGLTQEETASASDIDYKRYQRLEGGTVNATMRTLGRVAEALGTDVWTMLAG